jgi:drug/metabolite transporter (DMT)-like permease
MDKFKLVFVMLIWGSIGVFTRYINIVPIQLTFLRALVALPIIYIFYWIENKRSLFKTTSLKGALPYILSGVLLAIGWYLLFMAFDNTSISISVLVYNLSPVYVLLLAPKILKEKLSPIQAICIVVAFLGLGMIVSNAINGEDFSVLGITYGILSGMVYATIVLLNRKVKSAYSTTTITLIQMITACLVLLPFVIFGEKIDVSKFDITTMTLILILGTVHTGLAYYLYFSVYKKMRAASIVSIGYLEPVFSIILSAIILKEVLQTNQIIGGVLILAATFVAEKYKIRKLR